MRLKYLAILAFFLMPFSASAAYVVPQGGTGQSTLPASQLLTGNGTAAIYGTATTSVSNGTGISFTGTAGALVGGTNLTITNSSPLSGLSASYPFSFSTPTLSWIGLATSTELVSGYIPFATGVNTIGVDSAFIWDNTNKRLGIGSTTPGSLLSVGNSGWNFYNNATSSKSGTGGINIAGGCYAIEGTCLSTGGSGTVTSIATNNGITGGTITTSGTIGLAAIAANSVLGNISGSSAVPTALATSSLFQNASASNTGLLTSTDWSTFNGKQPALSLLAGTYVNGDMCTYASSGTLLNCNTTIPTGTVTSVGLSDSNSTLTIGSTPVTTSGTITATLNLAHSNTWSVKQTFSAASTTALTAASEFNAPHSGTVPTLYGGDFYINTNSTASSSLAFSDGTNTHNLFAVHSFSMVLASSTLAYDGAYGGSGTTTLLIANPIHASKMNSYFCKTDVGTVYVGFGTGSATTTETQCTSSGTNVPVSSNNTWTGRQSVYIEVGHQASTPNNITVTADVEDAN